MDIIYLLLPLSLILSCCGLAAYLWSVKNGQFDDLERSKFNPLYEDQKIQSENKQNK